MNKPFTGIVTAEFFIRKGNMLHFFDTNNKDHIIKLGISPINKITFEKGVIYGISIEKGVVSSIDKVGNSKLTIQV